MEEGVGVPVCPGSWPLCAELPHQPSLSLVVSPSVRTSLEVNLLPLNLAGAGRAPASLPSFLSTLESMWGLLQQMELGSVVKTPDGGR